MEVTLNPLQEKLLKIQGELKAPKNRFNKFGGYNYRDAEGILEAVKPLLVREGLLLTISDRLVHDEGGARWHVCAVVSLELGELIKEVMGYAREEDVKKGMDGSQITGASSSYARKYALNGLFLIDDNKDSDSTNDGAEEPKTTTKAATKEKKETPAAEKEEKKPSNKAVLEVGTKPYEGAVEWIANTDGLIFDLLDKIKKKYEITPEVEKQIATDAEAKRSKK